MLNSLLRDYFFYPVVGIVLQTIFCFPEAYNAWLLRSSYIKLGPDTNIHQTKLSLSRFQLDLNESFSKLDFAG